jgi:hypothetical protein
MISWVERAFLVREGRFVPSLAGILARDAGAVLALLGPMKMTRIVIAHPGARLGDADRAALTAWAR